MTQYVCILIHRLGSNNNNVILKKVLKKLDKLNLPAKYGDDIPFVKISDPDEAAEYGMEQESDLPKFVLFDNGIPEIYDDGTVYFYYITQYCNNEKINYNIGFITNNIKGNR